MKPLGNYFVIVAVIAVMAFAIVYFATAENKEALQHDWDTGYMLDPRQNHTKPERKELECGKGFVHNGSGCVEIPK